MHGQQNIKKKNHRFIGTTDVQPMKKEKNHVLDCT